MVLKLGFRRGQFSIEALVYAAIFLALLYFFIRGEMDILNEARAARRVIEMKTCAESAALFADFYGLDGKRVSYEKTFENARASDGFVECRGYEAAARAKTLHQIYWSGGVLRVNASKKNPI